MMETAQNWRRLLPLFVVTTVVPIACLVWLGWRVVKEDRQQRQVHIQEQRDQAAKLSASALQLTLGKAEGQFDSFNAAPRSGGRELADGAMLIAFGRDGNLEHAGTALPYYPVSLTLPERNPMFATADELEFDAKKADLAAALNTLQALSRSNDAAIAAEAILRTARIQTRLGNTSAALDTFTRLATFGELRVNGVPAALQSQQGRALIFEKSGRRGELEREASVLCDNLEKGVWTLSHGQFDQFYGQAANWLPVPRPPMDPQRVAIAEAVESLWQDWQGSGRLASNTRTWQTLHVKRTSILLRMRSTHEGETALLVAPRYLEAAWLDGLRSSSGSTPLDYSLDDEMGKLVLGSANAASASQSAQTLPEVAWTVHVITKESGSAIALSSQSKLVLSGIFMMALLALGAAYLVHRSILRELRVARLQSDFVAAVSHEFRTPLTTLRQLSEMLVKGRVSSDQRRQQFYETLLRESDRLHKLVEGLLNFGRMEAGQLKYRFEPVDPQEFLTNVVADFQREVAGRGYHVELHGGSEHPPIRADRESLARVFWNLLDNAVKYSPGDHTIRVDLASGDRRVSVRVQDHGIGIPAEEQERIFHKFVRGKASKNASIQGTGVGLAIASQIIAAHGGNISVESRPGEGSVFTVLLPIAET